MENKKKFRRNKDFKLINQSKVFSFGDRVVYPNPIFDEVEVAATGFVFELNSVAASINFEGLVSCCKMLLWS